MDVPRCYRDNCSNIICDRYSPIYGYICNSCFEKLVRSRSVLDMHTFTTGIISDLNSDKMFKIATGVTPYDWAVVSGVV